MFVNAIGGCVRSLPYAISRFVEWSYPTMYSTPSDSMTAMSPGGSLGVVSTIEPTIGKVATSVDNGNVCNDETSGTTPSPC